MPQVRRRTIFTLVATALSLVALAPGAALAQPRFGEIILSDEKDATDSEDTFETRTEKIYLTAQLVDVPRGTKVSSTWVAVSTRVAPPNFVIDSAQVTTGARVNVANFALSRPDNGWPVGNYRVDLAINGQNLASVKFKVR